MVFYAHSLKGGGKSLWQTLREHSLNVAQLARDFSACAVPADAHFVASAEASGLLHDLGKYRQEFQEMIDPSINRPKGENTRHKLAGAALAFDWWTRIDLALAIAGHHGGLPNCSELKAMLHSSNGLTLAKRLAPIAETDCCELALLSDLTCALPKEPDEVRRWEATTRLLFGCLVDADWLDTSNWHRAALGLAAETTPGELSSDQIEALIERVCEYIRLQSEKCANNTLRRLRAEILDAASRKAEESTTNNLYSLTVPTGGGKTLTSLVFALEHARRVGLRRIIYVAPYLTILEQNAREWRKALVGDLDERLILEHHSLTDLGSDPDGDSGATEPASSSEIDRLAENWDWPVVLTTNVQFFESLFSNRPSRCRKLHNIARSVVVLDECQTVPTGLVSPTCDMLQTMADRFGCSFVLCTATQPAWGQRPGFDDGIRTLHEIIPSKLNLFERLKRVQLVWPKPDEEPWTWPRVADEMQLHESALCVVNTKKKATALFDELRNRVPDDALFHLSTAMCAVHRLQIIDQIKNRLRNSQPCFLVSTQLIEAGVDIDFPVVLREMGPLESIIQAAGRCNRERLLNEPSGEPGGRVIVFQPLDNALPPDFWYRQATQIVAQDFVKAGDLPSIDRPQDIERYFERLYREGNTDEQGIQSLRYRLAYVDVAKRYELIDNDAWEPVVIASWNQTRDEVNEMLNQLQRHPSRQLFRRLARHQVNLLRGECAQLETYSLVRERDKRPLGMYAFVGEYDEKLGVTRKQGNWVG